MSKIDTKLVETVQKIRSFCSVDVEFGSRDIKASRRPIIELIPEDDGSMTINNSRGVTIFIPLTVNIVVDNKDELRAYTLLEQCLEGLNQIDSSGSNRIGSNLEGGVQSATMTQTYEDSTFKLAFPYTLSFLITGA